MNETGHVRRVCWGHQFSLVLSVSLHWGSLVANYQYYDTLTPVTSSSHNSFSPDKTTFQLHEALLVIAWGSD